jgi:hypothetical protein
MNVIKRYDTKHGDYTYRVRAEAITNGPLKRNLGFYATYCKNYDLFLFLYRILWN